MFSMVVRSVIKLMWSEMDIKGSAKIQITFLERKTKTMSISGRNDLMSIDTCLGPLMSRNRIESQRNFLTFPVNKQSFQVLDLR